ncbi:MAG: type II toxin-antitoxin system RelE/ParE family toxin [Verrucomicrobiota bacterium]
MICYETDVFTARITELIDDESYAALQEAIVVDPEAGDLIPRSKGLRKIRWRGSGRGKRGGIRVIYYLVHQDAVYMLYAYPKNKETDLSQRHLQVLRDLVDQHLEP